MTKTLSDAFNQLRLQFGDKLSSLQPWAHAATASAALNSLGFSAKRYCHGDSGSGKDWGFGDGWGHCYSKNIRLQDGTLVELGRVGDGGWMGQGTFFFHASRISVEWC